MGKLFLIAIIALAGAYTYPGTRPQVIEALAPVLDPVRKYQTHNEMERIAEEMVSFERTYYKLPTSTASFQGWLNDRFQSETAVDSWERPYALQIWPDSFAIRSGGPDLSVGTSDDVVWMQNRKR